MDYPTFLAEAFGQPEDSDPVDDIGNRFGDRLDYLCYMFRDTFVVYPGNAPPRVIDATIDVMAESLRSDCEACQVSALHGLGHCTGRGTGWRTARTRRRWSSGSWRRRRRG